MIVRARHSFVVTLPECGTLRITQGQEFAGPLAEALARARPQRVVVLEPAPATYTAEHIGGGMYEIRDSAGRLVAKVRGRAQAERTLNTLTHGGATSPK